ncbi:hypothetical protein Q5H93_08470 [Hymenobacter sp. ASUV-10]|uniref:Uncharacterized protein n=1 Tax=Hymenobacter aranciens TaxID=3063996 RepID=A0ABT9BAQ0_9BACT|nr:hypothetical protein [Hymenobacter sp. ASUV-10]MDO7874764.1 hypothetical protein [Hymenobacter sp. ASUV-10]
MPAKGFDEYKKTAMQAAIAHRQGALLADHVGPAHESDRTGGKAALQKLSQQGFERLAEWTRAHYGWQLQTITGLTGRERLTTPLTRWVVKHFISWLHWDRGSAAILNSKPAAPR